jgi:hypothetical protein
LEEKKARLNVHYTTWGSSKWCNITKFSKVAFMYLIAELVRAVKGRFT